MSELVRLVQVEKIYETGRQAYPALAGVSLSVAAGEFVAVMGHSGSGKSTLLHLAGGLDRPSAGYIFVAGHEIHTMDETALARFRRHHVGFVFQFFNLIDNLSVRDNVELPALLNQTRVRNGLAARCDQLLEQLDIAHHSAKLPAELSGGQQQRVAIARALINNPPLLLADEPTGNLDSANSRDVLDLLAGFNGRGQTILMVTHDPLAAARADRILILHDGRLVDELPGGDVTAVSRALARG